MLRKCSVLFFSNENCYNNFYVFTYASLLLGQEMASSKPFHFLPQIGTDPAIKSWLKVVFFRIDEEPPI